MSSSSSAIKAFAPIKLDVKASIPPMGVDVYVIFVKYLKPKVGASDKAPLTMICKTLAPANVAVMGTKTRPLKADDQPEYIPAMSTIFVKIFGKMLPLVSGGVYVLKGVVRTMFKNPDMETERASIQTAQIDPYTRRSLNEFIQAIPFDDRTKMLGMKMRDEDYDVKCPTSTFAISMMPYKTTDIATQPPGTAWAFVCPVNVLGLVNKNKDGEESDGWSNGSGQADFLQIRAFVKRTADQPAEQYWIQTRVYHEALDMLQLKSWKDAAPILGPFMSGTLVCSIDTDNTSKYSSFDDPAITGAAWVYNSFYPDLPMILREGARDNSFIRVPVNTAVALANKFKGTDPVKPSARWSNDAINLCLATPELVSRVVSAAANIEFYVVSNHTIKSSQLTKLLALPGEEELKKELLDVESYPKGNPYVEVFAISGGGHRLDDVLSSKISYANKEAEFQAKKKQKV